MRLLLFFMFLSSVLNFSIGCSSTSSIMHAKNIEGAITMYVPPTLTPYQKKYIPQIIEILKKHGFKIVDTKEHADLFLYFKIEKGAMFRIDIQLRDGRTPLIQANSKGLGLPGAINQMFKTTLNHVDKELSRLESAPEY